MESVRSDVEEKPKAVKACADSTLTTLGSEVRGISMAGDCRWRHKLGCEEAARRFKIIPRVAMLSFSSFGMLTAPFEPQYG